MTAGDSCILDASALLTILHGEVGQEIVIPLLDQALMSAVNWSETVQKAIARGVDTSGLRDEMEALGLVIVPFTVDEVELAARLWVQTRKAAVSLGDRACLALAARLELPVITADRTWIQLGLHIEIILVRPQDQGNT